MKPHRSYLGHRLPEFLIGVLLCAFSPVHAETLIGGTCSRDTTFALANGPYTLSAALNVYNCTVTFERGVQVNLNGHSIVIGYSAKPGSISAEGVTFANSTTSDQYVSFNAGSGGVLQNCVLDNVAVSISLGSPTITGCTVKNVDYPFLFKSPESKPVLAGNDVTGAATPRIGLDTGFDFDQNGTIRKYEIDYVLLSVIAARGCTLTIEPGVRFDLRSNSFTVGASGKPAAFNADGAIFTSSSSSDRYIRFDYGSGGAITGCTFDNVYLAVTDGAPVVHTSNFLNTAKGIVNSGAQVVNAENNYWGDSSGPAHASNPGGKGIGVSDNVDFDPWLAAEPVDRVAEEPLPFAVSAPYPNPFNPSTTIHYTLPEDCAVEFVVYDIRGARVAVLASGFRKAGRHNAVWNGRTLSGAEAASGVYLYRVKAGGRTAQGKVVLMR